MIWRGQKCELRGWGDGVDTAECETEEAVIVGVLLELGRDLLGSFDSLARHGRGAHRDGVSVDVTGGRGLITVGDGPGGAGQEF